MSIHTEELMQFIIDHPDLENCFLEMMEIAKDKSLKLNNGDDAEEAVVQAIEKAGQVILQNWAAKKEKQARQITNLEDCREHEKKISAGIPPLV
jgi:Ni,Fe-hydrogenase I small subunit